MAAGCPAKCAKFLLIIFNIIFWLSGAALLAIGIWLLVDKSILQYFEIIYSSDSDDQWFKYAAYVLIAVGAFTFITGFAGCCGAIKESPCLLGVYICLLVIVMLVEIAAGVMAFVFRNKIENEVGVQLSKTLTKQNYTGGLNDDGDITYSGFGTSMNLFQQEFMCCGVNGSGDYAALMDKAMFVSNIPYACCPLDKGDARGSPQIGDVTGQSCTSTNAYPDGCNEALKGWFEKNAMILIGLGIGIACLEVLGIIIACCFCRGARKDE